MAPEKASKPARAKRAAKEKAPKKLRKVPFWIGFDLGGTKMMASVLDANYNVLGSARKSTNGSDGAAKGRGKILKVVHEAIQDAGVDPAGIQGIGIGCPGLVNPSKGILIFAPNLGWKNMALRKMLQTEFKCAVAVLNDVDAGTFGEYAIGAGKGARSLLGVFPGTGLGAGFVYDGHLVMGRAISAMELGNLLFPGTHIGSPVFGTVTLEDLTSRLALASQAGLACYRGQLPDLDKKTQGALRSIRSKALANTFRTGEDASVVMFRNAIRYLGMGVANIVNLLAPDRITLGGGLVEELPELYLNLLKEEVERHAIPELSRGVKYTIAKLGGQAVAAGAVAWLRKENKQ